MFKNLLLSVVNFAVNNLISNGHIDELKTVHEEVEKLLKEYEDASKRTD